MGNKSNNSIALYMRPLNTEVSGSRASEHTNGRERIFHLVRQRTCALGRNLEAMQSECSDCTSKRAAYNQTAQDAPFQTSGCIER